MKCSRCGGTNKIEIHHKLPKSEGGTDTLENLIPLCLACHDYIHFKERIYCQKEKGKWIIRLELLSK